MRLETPPAQVFAAVGAAAFLCFGVLELADVFVHRSNAQGVVHVLVGVAGAVVAGSEHAGAFLLAGGVLSLLLWLLGVTGGGWLSADRADNWLHFGLGLALLALRRVAG